MPPPPCLPPVDVISILPFYVDLFFLQPGGDDMSGCSSTLTATSSFLASFSLFLAYLLLANGLAPHPLIPRPLPPEEGIAPTEAPDNGSNSFGAVLQVNTAELASRQQE